MHSQSAFVGLTPETHRRALVARPVQFLVMNYVVYFSPQRLHFLEEKGISNGVMNHMMSKRNGSNNRPRTALYEASVYSCPELQYGHMYRLQYEQ